MKSGPAPKSPGDDVTSAAESLLGIDLSSSQLPGAPIDLDDSDLFGEPDAPAAGETPEIAATTVEVAASVLPPAAPDDDFGSDFGAGLDSIPEPVPAVVKKPTPPAPPKAAVPATVKTTPPPKVEDATADELPADELPADELPTDELPAETVSPVARKDDGYWDALEGWDWGEESGAGKSDAPARDEGPRRRDPGRSRGRSGGRSERPREERAAPADPPRARRVPVDDDFGGGLEDAPPAEKRESEPAPDGSILEMRPTESQARPAKREREPERRREPPAARPVPPPVDDMDDGDDFGAGLAESPAGTGRRSEEPSRSSEPAGDAEGREQRRGRRRRGRGRTRDAGGSEASEDRAPVTDRGGAAPVIDDVDDEAAPEDFGEREEFAEREEFDVQESQFQDVPTWAEAISLLVKSRSGTAESAGGDRGRSRGSSSNSGERGGGRGRGRGGRRGGGRR